MITLMVRQSNRIQLSFWRPETQPMMLRLKSDLVELIEAANREELDKTAIEFDPRAAVGVVLAAKGYPDSYPKVMQSAACKLLTLKVRKYSTQVLSKMAKTL